MVLFTLLVPYKVMSQKKNLGQKFLPTVKKGSKKRKKLQKMGFTFKHTYLIEISIKNTKILNFQQI